MEVLQADFIASFPREKLCPPAEAGVPEFAFIGRSNVGKSSLINMLTGRKGLAKVSSTPGKTQLLNYFLINGTWYLVDLPGYGYAKVSKQKQRTLSNMIADYLQHRPTLMIAFVLIDSNIPPTKIDLEFIRNLGELDIPFALVFTKTDRMGKTVVERNIKAFLDALAKDWEALPPYFISSSVRRTGRDEILKFIDKTIKRSA